MPRGVHSSGTDIFVRSHNKTQYEKSTRRSWLILGLASIALVLFSWRTTPTSWKTLASASHYSEFIARDSSVEDASNPAPEKNPVQLFSSNNLTDQVQWDQNSLVVKGQRVFLQCVHYT